MQPTCFETECVGWPAGHAALNRARQECRRPVGRGTGRDDGYILARANPGLAQDDARRDVSRTADRGHTDLLAHQVIGGNDVRSDFKNVRIDRRERGHHHHVGPTSSRTERF